MIYSCRPGIVLTKICGQWLLIPTRAASEHCPNVTRLTFPAALIWGMIEKRKSREDIQRAMSILTHDETKARDVVRSIIDSLLERSLLLTEDEQ